MTAADNTALPAEVTAPQPAAGQSTAELADSAAAPPATEVAVAPGEPAAAAPPGPAGEAPRSTENDFIDALKQVVDPELMVNIVDLGLVYAVTQDAENDRRVLVEMTLTSPACPAGPQIVQQARMALERLHDVDEARITLTMSPPWTPDRMTDDAKDQLGIF